MATTIETIKRVTVQGRSEGLDKVAKGLKDVEAGMKGVGAAGQQTTKTTDTQQKSVVALSAHMDRLQGNLDRVFKAEQEFERAVKRTDAALKQGAISTERHSQLMGLLSNRLQQVRDDSSHAVNALTRTNFAAGQLTYQLNDVFTGVVTGQSPFMIAAQQAGQFSQILGAQGGGVRGALSLLSQSFLSMLNPINGMIIGLGAAATAAAWFFSSSEEKSNAAEEALKRHEELIERITKRYGEAGEAAMKLADEKVGVTAFRSRINLEERQADLEAQSKQFLENVGSTTEMNWRGGPGQYNIDAQFRGFEQAINSFRASIAAGKPDVQQLLQDVKNTGDASDTTTQAIFRYADSLVLADEAMKQAQAAAMLLRMELNGVGAEALAAAANMGKAYENMNNIMQLASIPLPAGDHGVPTMAEPRSPGAIGTPGNRPEVPNAPRPPDGGNPKYDETSDYGVIKPKRGGGGGGRDPFEAAMESARQRLQLLEQEKVALGLTGDALVRYKAEQQVLNSARGEFEKMSPAHQAAIEAEAKKVGDATVELEKMKKAQEALKTAQKQGEQAMEALGSSLENVFMGIIEGGDAAKQAIMQLVAQLLKAALLGTNGGGPLGVIFGGGLLGGIVKTESAGAGGGGPQRASRSSIRVPTAPRAAGNTSFAMHVAGNLDHSVMPEIRAELRSFQRDFDRRQEQREADKWRRA